MKNKNTKLWIRSLIIAILSFALTLTLYLTGSFNFFENKTYDRIGIQDDEIEIMGVRVPHQLMPIKPGRNLAIIVEVAARNLSLKRTGYNAARELSSLFQDDTNE